jgi:potassium-transporting ATPase potassium-binding subunit
MSVWILPALLVAVTIALSVPLSIYLAWIMDGRYKAPAWLAWVERRFDTGGQNWKHYAVALLLFNTLMFVFGFAVLAAQPYVHWGPLDSLPEAAKNEPLAPTTIFNTVTSFLTNTNLQDYSGEVHLSYFSQIFFILWNMFVSASVGFCALAMVTRALRGDKLFGNYYLDMWRVVAYIFLPLALLTGVLLMAGGMPMTFDKAAEATTVEKDADGNALKQNIARGPVAAVLPIKHLGTNGGGFFGANSAHPFENPTAWSDFLEMLSFLTIPFALVLMFGRMLKNMRHAYVIYGVMLFMFLCMIGWGVYWDSVQPNPGLTQHDGRTYSEVDPQSKKEKKIELPEVVALPVDQEETGNLEGKELRFGRSAGPTFAASTTAVTCGSVNCMHDSLNPLAGLTPMTGMWLNCVFGGKGVGMINLLVYLVVGVFLSGLMVGRTPEYLGKKIEAKEMKLAMLALLIHPILILGPAGLFAARDWGTKAESNVGAHGFSQILYQFTSSSANNGSGFEGLGDTWGFNRQQELHDKDPNNYAAPSASSPYYDVATGLMMLIGRFVPIIAPMALAAALARKKLTPFTVGTLRTDTFTFAFVLLGTILLVGALLFMPAAVLAPVAEHLGPIPFAK